MASHQLDHLMRLEHERWPRQSNRVIRQGQLSTATKTPPDVCLRSSPLALSSIILPASAANLRHSLAYLLSSSISSFLNLCSFTKKISHLPFYLLVYSFSVLQADPLSKVHLNTLASFSISVKTSPFWLLPSFVGSLQPPASSDLHFLLHPHHCLRSSFCSFCCSTDT